jgi:uncharacterized membrane protein YeaQ/YmgE (transglycosylase-associated protein family)
MFPLVVIAIAVVIALWLLIHIAFTALFVLVPWIILGALAGWIASKIVNSHYGLGGDILVGIGGSIIGGALATLFHFGTGGVLSIPHILVSIVGSVILLFVLKMVGRRSLI